MKESDQCELFVEWLHAYFIRYVRLSISDQHYIIQRYIGNMLEVEPTYINNPYIQSLSVRQRKQKYKYTDIFMSFIPRQKYGGTRFTFGKGTTFNQLVEMDIL